MPECDGYHWVNVTFVENGKRYASQGCPRCGKLDLNAKRQEIPIDDITGLAAHGPDVFFTYAAQPLILSGKGVIKGVIG